MRKIYPYLLLNILLSALTMLSVILIWNAAHPRPELQSGGQIMVPPPEVGSIDLPPLDEKTVEIAAVFMPSDLEFEKLTLKCVSLSPVDLSGWKISNSQGAEFTFPSLTIYPNGVVDLYSRSGMNSAVELFWNNTESVWSSGEAATLSDPAGNVRSTYTIP
ncbi:MAG: lamin tail domain-containing protein [Chloroflexi bacterium]|nr:lamin tail domain-containing protein [Chloroflexota bacterium]